MNPTINPTLLEDIQSAIEKFADGNTWEICRAEDRTDDFKNLFGKFGGASFNEIRCIYHYIALPHELHVTLEDEWTDIDITFGERLKFSEKNCTEKQTINLYISDRAPQLERGILELGMRLVQISWSILFRSVPYGINQIQTSLSNTCLENPERLPLLLKIIEEVAKVPTVNGHT